MDNAVPKNETFDALVIGAGFAGMYSLYRLREQGFLVRAIEAAPDVGGTWYHNRYPGCRCDVESLEYAFTFSSELRHEWGWTERYAAQPEILAYARRVADRFDLRRDITFNTRIVAAHWHEQELVWYVTSKSGATMRTRWLILGTGCLSVPRMPSIPGIETLQASIYHTANWPEEGVDLSGLSVGLIGTGSSGVQVAPQIARDAKHLIHFQRTPAYSIPARNRPLSDGERAQFRERFKELDAWAARTRGGVMAGPPQRSVLEVSSDDCEDILQTVWARGGAFPFLASFTDIQTNPEANHKVADFVRARIREIVKDPDTANALCPTDLIATRRLCVDTGYYEIFNRTNVTLTNVANDPIERFTQSGLRLRSGRDYVFDALVLATGYDAMTGAILGIDIRGRRGLRLADEWQDGPKTYLGLMIAGFPNLFTIAGPGSPSVLTNMIRSIEQHVNWITDCLVKQREQKVTVFEAERDAQENWVAQVNAIAQNTLFPRAASWYMGADIPGKPRVFMPYAGGLPAYREICEEVARGNFRGFRQTFRE
jgi:cyclohexanone monooxygenase